MITATKFRYLRRQRLWSAAHFVILLLLPNHSYVQSQPSLDGPTRVSHSVGVVGDYLHVHGGISKERLDDGQTWGDCSSEHWRLQLERTHPWDISSHSGAVVGWEFVETDSATITPPPSVGMGTVALVINNSSNNVADMMTGFFQVGRADCALEPDLTQHDINTTLMAVKTTLSHHDPVDHQWRTVEFGPDSEWSQGDWSIPVLTMDRDQNQAYVILQSTLAQRQSILSRNMSNVVATTGVEEGHALMIDQYLQGWTVVSTLNEHTVFVSPGTTIFINGSLVVLGGSANAFTPDDMGDDGLRAFDHANIFSLETLTWTRQALVAAVNSSDQKGYPPSREMASVVKVPGQDKIMLFGGIQPFNQGLKDLWILDTLSWQWTRLPDGESSRAHHTLMWHRDYLLVVSGYDVSQANLSAPTVLPILVFDFAGHQWVTVISPKLSSYEIFSWVTSTSGITTISAGAVILVFAGVFMAVRRRRLWKHQQYRISKIGSRDGQQASENLGSFGRTYAQLAKDNHFELDNEDDDEDDDQDTEWGTVSDRRHNRIMSSNDESAGLPLKALRDTASSLRQSPSLSRLPARREATAKSCDEQQIGLLNREDEDDNEEGEDNDGQDTQNIGSMADDSDDYDEFEEDQPMYKNFQQTSVSELEREE